MECTVLKVPGDRRTRWGVWACQGSLETAQRGAPGPPTAGPQFPGKEQTWAPRRLAGGGHGPRSPENGERWVALEGGDMGLGPGMTRGQRKAAPGGAASSHALGEESGAAPGGEEQALHSPGLFFPAHLCQQASQLTPHLSQGDKQLWCHSCHALGSR